MKTRLVPIFICITSLLFLTIGGSAAPGASPLGNAFTYQGRLVRDGAPYTGSCDFLFSLFDAETEGAEIGETVAATSLAVTGGLFNARLDFGVSSFNGDARWLEVAVQCPGDLAYTVFPRQELTASPYALYASSAPWSGITGKPAGLDDGDNDTTYTSGYGLTLAGGAFSINSDEFQVRVNDNCPAGSSIRAIYQYGDVSCETDDGMIFTTGSGLSLSDGILSIFPGYTQRRVSSSCEVGRTIRVINEDGSVECGTSSAGLPPFSVTAIDNTSTATQMAITIGSDGLGLISYYRGTHLKIAHCNDMACNNTTVSTIDSNSLVGNDSSIVIGSDGLGIISYFDSVNGDLKIAKCDNVECTSASTHTIASDGNVGMHSSITIGLDGFPLISYVDYTNTDLKVAHCLDSACSSVVPYTIDSTNSVGWYSSITIGADGLGLVSYQDQDWGDLKVAHCTNIDCSTFSTFILDPLDYSGYYTSITTGTDGLGLISYYNNTLSDLKVAHCNNPECSSATINTLDTDDVGKYSSITIGADGLGLISYWDEGNSDLKVAHCIDQVCSSAMTYTLDSPGSVGKTTSITVGTDGFGLISYIDDTNYQLKVLHCSNSFCMPYFRQR